MDRSPSSAPHRPTAVRTAGSAALDLLLPAAAGKRGEPPSAPPTRPLVPEAPVLRQPQNGRRAGSESQAHAAPDAHSGHRSPLPQTELEPPGAGSPDLPVPAARRGNPPAQPRLEYLYYLHSDAGWLSVPGRGNGLVQPLRTQLGTLQYDGNQLLPGGAGRVRSGLAVHLGRFPRSSQEARDRDQ